MMTDCSHHLDQSDDTQKQLVQQLSDRPSLYYVKGKQVKKKDQGQAPVFTAALWSPAGKGLTSWLL